MGEVYRAKDVRLGRSVAVKIIAGELSADPKRRERFVREAKAISSLNHPNICALYDVGELSVAPEQPHSVQYIVMEYLEGETLEVRLSRGALPIEQVVRYGTQIADALDKAHRNGILHRDLKPSNIMITKAGARLFDFGLAKSFGGSAAAEPTADGVSQSSTLEKAITADGAVVGTPSYVAPEQLIGREPDARTDIFALGVTLYQMLTRKRPFEGDTRAQLTRAILSDEPAPLTHVRPDTPRALQWVVRNCLAKDPDERLQTAHDVALELKRIADDLQHSSAEWGRRFRPRTALPYAAAMAVVALVGIATFWQWHRSETRPPDVRRFSIVLPTLAPLAAGNYPKFAVAADGSRIVYVAASNPERLYLHSLETLETTPIAGTEGARGPFFSPDGKWIGFYTADGDLRKVALETSTRTSSASMLLTKAGDVRGATWTTADEIIFAALASPLRRVSSSGGQAEPIELRDAPPNVRWPFRLPKTNQVLVTLNDYSGDYENAKLASVSVPRGEMKVLVNGATYGQYADGHLVYVHSSSVFAVPFDAQHLTVTGAPALIASDADTYFGSGLAQFALANGTLFYLPRDITQLRSDLVWVNRSGEATVIGRDRRAYEDPRLAPDGKTILVSVGPQPRSDLWLYDIRRDGWTRLTTTQSGNSNGVWSPDGRQIAFASNQNGKFDLYIVPSDGSGKPVQIVAPGPSRSHVWDFPWSWSSDGQHVLVVEQFRSTFNDIAAVSPQPGSPRQPVIASPFDERDPVFAPNGQWIAYRSNETGRDEIYVQRYPPAGRRWQVSTDGGTNPVWRRDGRELFYRRGKEMVAVKTTFDHDFSSGKPQVLFSGDFEESFDVTADGSRFVMVKRSPESPRTQINAVVGALGAANGR